MLPLFEIRVGVAARLFAWLDLRLGGRLGRILMVD